jgi:Amt family ammonium transporter
MRRALLGNGALATLVAVLVMSMAAWAGAADAPPPPAAVPAAPAAPWTANTGDQAWMLASSALVLFMTPGLAFFYGGLVRRKNVLSVLMQCFMCMALVTVLWVVVGFSMAFGDDCAGGFMGNPLQYFLVKGLAFDKPWQPVANYNTGVSQQTFMIFQAMFAIITPGLIIGAFAERMKFAAFTVFMAVWTIVVYSPVAHWVWFGPEGFFGLGVFDAKDATAIGALDFAGGTVVHINAGIAALVACLVMGKRQGYPEKISPPHNLPFAVLGAGMLWFGWFGFNGGSAIGAGDQAVRAFVVTHVAAAAAGLVWSIIEWVRNGHPTVLGMITGAVAGLVAITPASGFVDVGGALCIGAGASVISYIFVAVIKPALGYDDSLDVFNVHGMSGIWGAIATGIFAVVGYGVDKKGGLLAGNPIQVWVQIKAVLFTVVYSGVMSFIILKVIDMVMGLKASQHNERVGLDLTDHAEAAYTLVE